MPRIGFHKCTSHCSQGQIRKRKRKTLDVQKKVRKGTSYESFLLLYIVSFFSGSCQPGVCIRQFVDWSSGRIIYSVYVKMWYTVSNAFKYSKLHHWPCKVHELGVKRSLAISQTAKVVNKVNINLLLYKNHCRDTVRSDIGRCILFLRTPDSRWDC